jgi:hypothetical protein
MTDSVERFIKKLRRVVDSERDRGGLTYATCVGCLEVIKTEIIEEMPISGDEDE